MIRLFEQHKVRKIKELDGLWDFSKASEDKIYKITVPGCWEQHPSLNTYRGQGVFSTTVEVSCESDILLEFKGVSHTGKLYFDGTYIGQHYNAFTPFRFIVSDVKEGLHELKVEVDNTFGEHSALHTPNDYYTYGGLTRPVSMSLIPKTYIKHVKFIPFYDSSSNEWEAKIDITIVNHGEATSRKVKCNLHNNEYSSDAVELKSGEEKVISFVSKFKDVESWSHANPKLYFLNTVLIEKDIVVDDFIERVGFRTVEVKGSDILLNGKKVFLKGFNRHEDHITEGCALSLQNMVLDMDLMQDMNVNAVRTSHYPNDERFLDLCDERGIMVWEESHARGFVLEPMQNPNFNKQSEDCINEMIENHYNHPSIIIWGILNECASETEEGRKMYQMQFDQIDELDKTRPKTFATCRHFKDICLDLPDIVSFNMYTGWYQDLSILERHNKEIDWINSANGEGKPLIVSEFGAGGIYGNRDRRRLKWSEERQADIIEDNLEVYKKDDRLSGIFIWQFADCRVTEEEWFDRRPRSYNNKGVLDEYRRPKIAYDVVKKYFSEM